MFKYLMVSAVLATALNARADFSDVEIMCYDPACSKDQIQIMNKGNTQVRINMECLNTKGKKMKNLETNKTLNAGDNVCETVKNKDECPNIKGWITGTVSKTMHKKIEVEQGKNSKTSCCKWDAKEGHYVDTTCL